MRHESWTTEPPCRASKSRPRNRTARNAAPSTNGLASSTSPVAHRRCRRCPARMGHSYSALHRHGRNCNRLPHASIPRTHSHSSLEFDDALHQIEHYRTYPEMKLWVGTDFSAWQDISSPPQVKMHVEEWARRILAGLVAMVSGAEHLFSIWEGLAQPLRPALRSIPARPNALHTACCAALTPTALSPWRPPRRQASPAPRCTRTPPPQGAPP